MNIDTDQKKWVSGAQAKDFTFYVAQLYLSVFICVHLW